MVSSNNQILAFFNKTRKLLERKRKELADKEERGDLFNAFKILRLSTAEVRTHSTFIAELLNPHGSHGMGTAPLQLFLDTVFKRKIIPLDNIKFASVKTEKSTGEIDMQYTHGGQIDIIISSGKSAIIIENKIDAQDQFRQLVRYNNYGKEHFEQYSLIYLTKYGVEATKGSVTDDKGRSLVANRDYLLVSYKEHILPWLEGCVKMAGRKTKVRESIKQYYELIKEITIPMAMDNELQDLMIKNIELVKMLNDNLSGLYGVLISDVIPKIFEKIANDLGLVFENKEFGKSDHYAFFYRKEWKHAAIAIGKDGRETRYYISVQGRDGILDIDTNSQLVLKSLGNQSGRYWPFGYKYLHEEIAVIESVGAASIILSDNPESNFESMIRNAIAAILKEINNLDDRQAFSMLGIKQDQ